MNQSSVTLADKHYKNNHVDLHVCRTQIVYSHKGKSVANRDVISLETAKTNSNGIMNRTRSSATVTCTSWGFLTENASKFIMESTEDMKNPVS